MGSSRTRTRTRVPCIGRRILNHCTTKEALLCHFIWRRWASLDLGIHRGPRTNPTPIMRDDCIYTLSLPEGVRIWTVHLPHLFGQGASSCPFLCYRRGFPSGEKELSWGLNFVEKMLRAAKLYLLDFGGILIRVSNSPICLEQSVLCALPQHNSDRLPTFTLQSALFEGWIIWSPWP